MISIRILIRYKSVAKFHIISVYEFPPQTIIREIVLQLRVEVATDDDAVEWVRIDDSLDHRYGINRLNHTFVPL